MNWPWEAAMRKLVLLAVLAGVGPVLAQPLDPKDVPGPLKPWVDWTLRGHEEARCPPVARAEALVPECFWPARLELEVGSKGATFRLHARRYAPGFIAVPGSKRLWPVDVRVSGKPAPVVAQQGTPSVEATAGDISVEGAFIWDSAPASLPLPPGTALVHLAVNGTPVSAPDIDSAGQLLLSGPTTTAENERLDIQVQRKITDGVPMRLDTRVVLDVAGRPREELLARALPEGFEPLALEAPLPARLEPDGRLRVQVRPGRWVINVSGRRAALTTSVARTPPEGPWTQGDEIWVFVANPSLRLVVVEGLPAVDPSQTQLPQEWRSLPAYAVRSGETMRLVVRRRGNSDREPNQLLLQRQLWLDFDGGGWSVSDHLSGRLSRGWRLEMPAPLRLGRVAIGGTDQPITRMSPQSAPGVEVRQGQLNLRADARLDGAARQLPAVAWDEDVTALAATLHLPPGWRLLAARGVDEVPGTWLGTWSLLELFLVLVLAVSASRLYGRWVGLLALVALVLTFPEPSAPQWTWLLVLVAEALVRVVPEGRLRQVMRGLRLAAFALLAVVLVQFAVEHLRSAMYPAIGRSVARADEGLRRAPTAEDVDSSESGEFAEAFAEAKVGAVAEKVAAKPNERVATTPSAPGFIAPKRAEPLQSVLSPISEVDRLAVVQTGPGVPKWQWTHVPLRWNGPVLRNQTLVLYLLSPGMARILAFLQVLLLGLLALALFEAVKRIFPKLGGTVAASLVVALALPGVANAQSEPSDARLEELRERLLAAPRCAPSCIAVSRLLLDADPELLRLRLEVSAAAAATLVLPGSAQQWLPALVLLDGQVAPAVRREGGRLILALPPGVHQVLLEGKIPRRKALQLALGLVPGYAQARVLGWKVDGIHSDGRVDDTLQLTRNEGGGVAVTGGELRSAAMPPFVRVDRHLRFGLTWEVDTEVVRLSAAGSAAVLSVPLIRGEAVNTPDVHVENGKVLVNLGPQAGRTSWHSTLEPLERVVLTAPADGAWVEQWTLDVGTMWHVVLGGIPPLYPMTPAGVHQPAWEPWPGESVELTFTRPVGAGGQTFTIDSTQLSMSPGLRATDAELSLTIRSSRGVQHQVTLPPGAELLQATVGGQGQPLRLEGGRVTLPIAPGVSTVQLRWREGRGLQALFAPEPVDVGAPSVNASTGLHLPADRWVLVTGGPLVGPAVLFWSLLVVTVLVAVALGKVTLVPISTLSWVLLGVGLTQVPVVAAAVVVACLLAFGWRARYGTSIESVEAFNIFQILLALLLVVSLVILFAAVRQGLLGAPDMQVLGNGSTATELRWFQDRTGGVLPRPWVLSVPLLVYRLAMLAWALWLVAALLRWFRWGAAAATSGGLWRKRSVKPSPAPPPPPVFIA
jgi:hypothetical protein